MKKIRLIGILVLILLMGNSCQTYKNLEKVKPITDSAPLSEEIQKLKPGDKIKVVEKNGNVRILEYVVTVEGVLRGSGIKGTQGDLISIRVEDIVEIQVKKINTPMAILKSVSVVYLLALVGLVSLVAIAGMGGS